MQIKTFLFSAQHEIPEDRLTNEFDCTINEFITQVESNGGKIIDVKMNLTSMDRGNFYIYTVSYEEPKK